MQLSYSTVLPYLLQSGVLTKESLVHEHWQILQTLGDKPVFKVFGSQGGWVVKQHNGKNNNQFGFIQREHTFLKLVGDQAWAKEFRDYVPKVQQFDRLNDILITEYLPYDTGLAYMRRKDANGEIFGKLVGEAIAHLHNIVIPANKTTSPIGDAIPYILMPNERALRAAGFRYAHTILKIMRAEKDLICLLVELGKDWEKSSLIHYDIKLDNVLIKNSTCPKIWIIDWASLGVGDPAWDIGTMIQSVLTLWLHSMSFDKAVPLAEAAQKARLPWNVPREYIKSLYEAYFRVRLLDTRVSQAFLRKSLQYAGAALLFFEIAHAQRKKTTFRQLASLQLGSNLVLRPELFMHELNHDE